MTWPFGRSRPQQIAVSRSYFPVFPIGGVTTSLCCAQAPSPKALTRTATTNIVFNSFNLSRLLSPQVAPVCLGREQRGSNAFLNFFGCITNREPDLFRISGRSRACGHGFFSLSASTDTQSSGQNSHNHDRSYDFQSISPPFVASCRYPFKIT